MTSSQFRASLGNFVLPSILLKHSLKPRLHTRHGNVPVSPEELRPLYFALPKRLKTYGTHCMKAIQSPGECLQLLEVHSTTHRRHICIWRGLACPIARSSLANKHRQTRYIGKTWQDRQQGPKISPFSVPFHKINKALHVSRHVSHRNSARLTSLGNAVLS